MRATTPRCLMVTVWALSVSSVTPGATLVVDPAGGGDFTEIQAALDAAEDGDTVFVRPGEYAISESLDFNRRHDPEDPASPATKNLALRSEAGAGATTIRLERTPENPWPGAVICFESGESAASLLEGFTVTGGTSAGVRCVDSSPTLADCTFSGNLGSGVTSIDASPTLTHCLIVENFEYCDFFIDCEGYAVEAGDGGFPTLESCTISGNLAPAIALWGEGTSLTLRNSIVWGNLGGSIERSGATTLEVSFSTIESRAVCPGEGNRNDDPLFCGWISDEVLAANQDELDEALGGFRFTLSAASPCLGTGAEGLDRGARPQGCERPGAGRRTVRLAAGTYDISGYTLVQNVSLEGSGEAETVIEGTVRGLQSGAALSHLTVTAGEGVIITHGGDAEITQCSITRNAGHSGVFCWSSSPTFHDCTISENRSWGAGGGLYCGAGSSPMFVDCAIRGNSSDFHGGGVYAWSSSPTLINSAITGNTADPSGAHGGGNGGGLFLSESSSLLLNCLITGNTAHAGGGVAALSWDSGSVVLVNCTLAGNRALDGRGCALVGVANLTNCILSDHETGSGWEGCATALDWLGFSITFSSLEQEWPDAGNILSDPLFVRSGLWDGSGTPDDFTDDVWVDGDYRLRPDSPCIDAGTSVGAPPFDLDGSGRPCGAGVDMGAYEAGECPPLPAARFVRGDADALGAIDLSDAVFILNHLFLGGAEPPCRDAADVDDSGGLNITDGVYLLTYLFLGGPSPVAAVGGCAIDLTVDELGCAAFEACVGA